MGQGFSRAATFMTEETLSRPRVAAMLLRYAR
jgi:hypothetical protein